MTKRKRGKPRGRKRNAKGKGKAVEAEDVEMEDVQTKPKRKPRVPKRTSKGKGKAVEDQDVDRDVDMQDVQNTRKSRKKAVTSKAIIEDSEETSDEGPPLAASSINSNVISAYAYLPSTVYVNIHALNCS